MKAETIAVATSTAFFGLIVGWFIGSQHTRVVPTASVPAMAQAQAASEASAAAAPRIVDEAEVQALKNAATRDPNNALPRTQLGNLYFDAERYDDAVTWYGESLKVAPKDPDVSTDLAVSYYYLNQPDRALKQFDYSLSIEPKHTKTMLNMGIVRAFGKQDLEGAIAIWTKLIELAPASADAQAAKRALDSLKAAHPGVGQAVPAAPKTGKDD
jgi:tetratricopeptide (TPR) repeat protein